MQKQHLVRFYNSVWNSENTTQRLLKHYCRLIHNVTDHEQIESCVGQEVYRLNLPFLPEKLAFWEPYPSAHGHGKLMGTQAGSGLDAYSDAYSGRTGCQNWGCQWDSGGFHLEGAGREKGRIGKTSPHQFLLSRRPGQLRCQTLLRPRGWSDKMKYPLPVPKASFFLTSCLLRCSASRRNILGEIST